jgi:hypothetical protein
MKRIVVAVLLSLGLIATANAQRIPADTEKHLAKPVTLAQPDLPDVAECHGMISQIVLDLVNGSDNDPADAFEKNRKQHPHMMMVPPPIECASKLWKALGHRRGVSPNSVTVPAGSDGISLRQYPMESLFNVHATSASIGSNVNLANGIEGYQGENAISIDHNNPQHMIAFSNTFYKDPTAACQSPTGGSANTFGSMALFGSIDGGANWTYNCAPWPAAVSGGVPSAAFWFGSDPALAWDNQGRAYACYMLISQTAGGVAGASIVVARSSDNGTSWQNLGVIVNNITSTSAGDDKEMMAIDNTTGQAFSHPGRIYVIWDAANNEKIAYSDDGATWTTVPFASNTGAIGGNVVVGADGTVYVIWNRFNVETIVFSKSTDGGATWTAPAVISTMALQSFGTNNTPPAQNSRGLNAFGSIDIDRNPASAFFGTLYVAFPDFPTGVTSGSDINTYVIRSTNGGASWSSRVKVNDDSFGATQFFPWLSVDQSDGTLNVSWYDTRLDPLNRKTQMVYARSSNGGVSFEPNVLVTDNGTNWRNAVNYADENGTDNATFNANQYGDYSGISALNRQVHPLWTDSRTFFPLADTVSPTRREDNASATIVNCSSPSALTAPTVNPTTTPSVVISWAAPASWGTNATSGTYSVYRNTTNTFPGGAPLVSGLTATNYVDGAGTPAISYFYFVRAKNNCPGTILTPMTIDSPASASVVYGAAGSAVGILQGTVTSAGNAVSGATVTAGTFSATTNASGFYQFAAIDAATYAVGAAATGYSSSSVPGVIVSGSATTVQNLTLAPLTPASCFTDTTYADFVATTGTNVDVSGAPGDVKLQSTGAETPDQVSAPAGLSTTNNLSATVWTGQTFQAGVTGNLTKLVLGLGLSSGSSGTCTVEIRDVNGVNPGTTILATATAGPVTNVGSAALYTVTFGTPASVVAGTSYSIVLRISVGSTVFGVRGSTAGGSSLVNGQVFTTTTSGGTWTAVAADLWFTSYVTPVITYPAAGSITAMKDSGAVVGSSANWTTLSWTATTPANTSVKFQAAASNSATGPFTFVGPDGTAATFFTTSGASLAQFNGLRYLQYMAYLGTTDNTVTPTLSDVTVCKTVVDCTAAVPSITPSPAQVCASSVGNTATGPAGMTTYAWSITNGIITGGTNTQTVTYTAGASGSVGLSLTITNASGCQATGASTVSINVPATPTINASGPTTFCTGGSVTLTSSSASGNQWYLNGNPIGGATSQQYVATATGNYTVIVTLSGCTGAASAATSVTVNPIPATPTITPGGPTTFCAGGSVTLTSSSATGNQWYLNGNPIGGETNQQYVATASGNYTVAITLSGCTSAASAATSVTANPAPATPTVTPGGPTTFCTGGSVTLTSSSASGNQWYLNGTPIGGASNQQYIATATGNYTVIVTASGCPSAPSSATSVTVNAIPATPTITPGGPTTFCAGGSVTLTSSSATGNQWYLNGNPIGGQTSQQYVATASGNYSVAVTLSGCTSAASAATSVTVNPAPATPAVTPGGPTTFCSGGSVTLTSSSASGNQWYLNGNPIGGASNQQYIATATGNYTVIVTASGCPSAPSSATSVTVNPIPATPTITPGGPTTFCAGGSVTLTSSSATGNQWYLNGNPIGGQTSQQYIATASGNYSVAVTLSGCSSAASAATSVTVNPAPATPAVTPGGPTTFCTGGSVTLTSSSASGNQWYLNGNPIGGETNQQYVATATGSYTVIVTAAGCPSAPSSATNVTVNPIPATPTITPGGPTTFCAGGSVTLTSSSTTGNQWYLNGNPIGGATNQQYVATATGNYTVIVTTSGCSSTASSATTVTANPIPATPTINAGGPTTFCTGGSVTLTSSSAIGNQWFLNGNPIGGATNQQYVATATGNYTITVTASGCSSAPSSATSVTVNPIPATPTINAGGPTTFCAGGNITLTSSSAIGNQWFLNGNPIGGATSQQYVATATGNYTVTVTASGCSSTASSATTVTVNPIPATPTINAGGPTTFCTGGSVTLTSSSASGNQWFVNGNPIGGATGNQFVASVAGDYTVAVTATGCSSAASTAKTVLINPIPNATITAPASVVSASAGNAASVANAGAGATYSWSVTGGSITAGSGTPNVTFTAGAVGTLSIQVTVSAGGCSDTKSANVNVTAAAVPVTVTTVTPSAGKTIGGRPVTIGGTGFLAGASVTFGGTTATSVVVVNATTITAVTPAHVIGAVSVTVTNTNASTGTLTNGYTYVTIQFDPNGDVTVDPSDIFYLINYLFLSGPPPMGSAGLLSGDANGDGVVDPADIFYAINYIFLNGPAPNAVIPNRSAQSVRASMSGAVTLGEAEARGNHYVIPVIVTAGDGSDVPQALSLRVTFQAGAVRNPSIHRAGAASTLQPTFEISRPTTNSLSYLLVLDRRNGGLVFRDGERSIVVAEIELDARASERVSIDVDPAVTLLSDEGGTRTATVAARTLRVRGTVLEPEAPLRPKQNVR